MRCCLKQKVSGEVLLQLLNNVLDTAKISTGTLETTVKSHNIKEFLERMWIVSSEIIRKKKLYGVLCMQKNMMSHIEYDNHRLMQILINLVSNATKFTDSGFVKIYVDFQPGQELEDHWMKARYLNPEESPAEMRSEQVDNCFSLLEMEECEADMHSKLTQHVKKFKVLSATDTKTHVSESSLILDQIPHTKALQNSLIETFSSKKLDSSGIVDGYLRIEIVDSGCGIEPDQLNSIFHKFHQTHTDPSARQIGTGLGLWITKELVEMMQGRINAHSIPGMGTSLVLLLKTRATNQSSVDKPLSVPQRFDLQPQSLTSLRIMIVDDVYYNRDILYQFLRKCNVQEDISMASNGLEALDLFQSQRKQRFDVIFMDLDMPVLNGKLAVQRIREYEVQNSLPETHIVILTAYSDGKTIEALQRKDGPYRADSFLSKPASCANITQILQELVTKKSP